MIKEITRYVELGLSHEKENNISVTQEVAEWVTCLELFF
jgi:hypothetical protein